MSTSSKVPLGHVEEKTPGDAYFMFASGCFPLQMTTRLHAATWTKPILPYARDQYQNLLRLSCRFHEKERVVNPGLAAIPCRTITGMYRPGVTC